MTKPDQTFHLMGRSVLWNRSDRLAVTVLIGIWGIYLICYAATHTEMLTRPPSINSSKVRLVGEKIDPNTASPASLRRLPMIGPAKAEAIVVYRRAHQGQSGSAFKSEKDLEKVSGIGPETIERISRHLVFDERQP
ncbi:MAG: helix-hairpin-helix domain-containing protein [Planctomycetota bacterium]|nr:helix-hairpin-helix domain-containing protein [Planctomycetota bacterium]